ncbi:cytochrome b5 type B [Tiliqua scincoides]|uniref:cytochrome b5 type B n=1 Tax=Tiliqua scincoides TaxID=71010 RepID=UPI003462BA7E
MGPVERKEVPAGPGLEAPEGGRFISLEEVAMRNTPSELWIVIHGRVYDISGFLHEHPGGEEVLLEQGGRDATECFEDVGHSMDAREMLNQYLIGEVHPCDHQSEASKVPNKSPSNESSFWAVWLIPVLGALVLGLMYRYYVMDGKSS